MVVTPASGELAALMALAIVAFGLDGSQPGFESLPLVET
jgi:hypothetical protein